jgi:hypothetical protein
MLRMLGREEYSNYGPTADTGGLMQDRAPTIYAYPTLPALLEGEAAGVGRLSCRVRVPGRLRSGPINARRVAWPSRVSERLALRTNIGSFTYANGRLSVQLSSPRQSTSK